MRKELKALFITAMQNTAHLAFYRLPLTNVVTGYISNKLSDPSIDSEGFIISAFDPGQQVKLIQNMVNFKYDTTLELNYENHDAFTAAFQKDYIDIINSEDQPLHPFYNEQKIHVTSRHEYLENVIKAQTEIKNNAFNKVVLSRVEKIAYTREQNVIDIFIALTKAYPNAFISLISSPLFGTWIGASPEILLEQENDNYTTVAVAGTKKKENNTSFTNKEFEEQNIIKEYIQSYLESLNIKGNSSKIQDFNAGSLTHLKTSIAFSVSPVRRLELLEGLHPTPAVGGYPKADALQFISENENYSRDIYAGYIGPISKNTLRVFVNIRCMQWFPEYAAVYAGAGITGASDAEKEWLETADKMQVIGSVL